MIKPPKYLVSEDGEDTFIIHTEYPKFIANAIILSYEESEEEFLKDYTCGAITFLEDRVAVIGVVKFFEIDKNLKDANKLARAVRLCADWYREYLIEEEQISIQVSNN